MFTVDDVAAAGWKKSKQFDATSVPSASEVWYGFFDRRDIEVRANASHADALGPGAQSAAEAIGRSPNSNIGGGIITSQGNRVQYHAYLVVGNLVLLCQQDVEVCLRLVEKMPGKQASGPRVPGGWLTAGPRARRGGPPRVPAARSR
jgi:hypothetical protein